MQELNEYQKKIRELNKELLAVETVKCRSKEFQPRYGDKRTVEFRICRINHVSYVSCRDVCYRFPERKKTFIEHGLFDESDFCYFVASRGQATLYVRVDKLYEVRDEVTRACKDNYDSQATINPVVEAAFEARIQNVDVDYGVFARSQEAYRERIELMSKSKEVTRESRYQAELEYERRQEEMRIEEGKKEERTLRDLVEQIEAMGWNVTLSLKKA